MKRCLLIVLLLFGNLSLQEIKARSYPSVYEFSSRFELDSLDAANPVVLDNLEVLGRVWGFVKYHHPAMADTTIHIDYELFSLLPRVTHAKPSERNHILSEWIESFGPYEVDDVKYAAMQSDSNRVVINDFAWIRNTERLGSDLSRQLTELQRAVRKANRYVSQKGVTIGLYDDPLLNYSLENGSDTGYRLLLLFRLWNAIDSYCPNRNITDRAWDEVLVEYLPRMIREKAHYKETYMELLSELDDTHAGGPYGAGRRIVPCKGRIVDERLFITDPMENELLRRGDEILSSDGRSIPQIIDQVGKYTAQSNESVLLVKAASTAFRSEHDSLSLVVRRNGAEFVVKLPAMSAPDFYQYMNRMPLPEPFRMLGDDVAYLYAESLTSRMGPYVFEKIRDTKAVLIDLRCYPVDFSLLYYFFAHYFVSEPCCPLITSRPYWNTPGVLYTDAKPRLFDELSGNRIGDRDVYQGQVVILVDNTTLSRAEFFAMHLQAISGAITVGSQTAGADGNVVLVTMPDNMSFYFSGLKILYPDGTDTQRVGVRVDYEVKPTIEGLQTGGDEVLEYALSLVD